MATKKKILKKVLLILGVGILIAGGVVYYMFNKPARDVQNSKTDYSLEASQIVNEYLTDSQKADDKYLEEAGNSKVLEISGVVSDITEDFNNQKVILLQGATDKAGVSCTFTAETNANTADVEIGSRVTIKGVIRSGASYDEDLKMYENVILEKCDIVSK